MWWCIFLHLTFSICSSSLLTQINKNKNLYELQQVSSVQMRDIGPKTGHFVKKKQFFK